MSFEAVGLTEYKYREWDNFCLSSESAWFWHTSDTLEYMLNYRPALKSKNLSFFVRAENKILAIAPLFLETVAHKENKIFEFSFGSDALPAPALADNLDEQEKIAVYEFIFNQFDSLAAEYKVKRLRLRLRPLYLDRENDQYDELLKRGFTDISLSTQLIDLRKDEATLWKELRRNHRRNILKGEKFKIEFFDSENINLKVFNEYKEMHHKAAGRKTRPDKTFEIMFDQAKKGFGFLVRVCLEEKKLGYEFYTVYKKQAEGFSAANDPEFEYLPIRHRLEWEAMLWLKWRSALYYDIGLQQSGPLLYSLPTAKEINISHFKKGFGGRTVPLKTVEKFYDKKYFLEITEERKKNYEKFAS